MMGYPRLVPGTARAQDSQAQRRLWQESGGLTGVIFGV